MLYYYRSWISILIFLQPNGLFKLLAIGLVMSLEGINTAVEEIANFIHPEYHNKIGLIKDIAAGAVFICFNFCNYYWTNYLFTKDFLNS